MRIDPLALKPSVRESTPSTLFQAVQPLYRIYARWRLNLAYPNQAIDEGQRRTALRERNVSFDELYKLVNRKLSFCGYLT
jgi:hypothetical protein